MDVTFNEQKSYFTNSYLQGENSTREDKESLLLDLSLILVSNSTPTPPCLSCSNYPKNPSNPVPATPNEPQEQLNFDSVPTTPNEPQEQLDSVLGDVRFGKVYTRRKMASPEPMQVQESNSS